MVINGDAAEWRDGAVLPIAKIDTHTPPATCQLKPCKNRMHWLALPMGGSFIDKED
jgi:hypothetical protein